jgi:hypothetical protein
VDLLLSAKELATPEVDRKVAEMEGQGHSRYGQEESGKFSRTSGS